jgi:hypothetical protein
MRYWELHEAGIRTAEIDLMAKQAIRDYCEKLGTKVYKFAESKGVRLAPEDYDERWFKFYDDAWDIMYLQAYGMEFVMQICADLSSVLTIVVHKYMQEKYGGNLNGTWHNDVAVYIDCKDTSTDRLKDKAGGYYSTTNKYIKVFVTAKKIHEAAMAALQLHLYGDAETNPANLLAMTIAPIFAHEYAHFEQFARKNPNTGGDPDRDFGYVTTGVKDRGGKGKRGGLMRTPDESPHHQLRYYGSSHEIDSFAAGAASEIVEELKQGSGGLWNDLDSNLRDFLKWMGNDGGPQTNHSQYQHYEHLMWNVAQGYYDKAGVKRDQIDKVWNRFRKLVYQKLLDYLEKRPGKSKEAGLDPLFVQVAEKYPRAQAVKEIAEIAAVRAVFGSPEWEDVEHCLRYNDEIESAKTFLSQFYYGVSSYMADEHPGLEQMLEYANTLIRARVTEKKLEQQREAEARERQPELTESEAPTMTLWHGGRDLESSHREVRSHKGGRWEHGPGLYLTSRYETAAKYAKGGGKLYRVTIGEGRDISQVEVPLQDAEEFVNRYCVGSKRRAMIDDLRENAQRVGVLRAEVLVNLCLNHEAIPNTKTGALRQFLIDHGVDYGMVRGFGGRNDETVVVVINPRIITKVEAVPQSKVGPDEFHLSTEWK